MIDLKEIKESLRKFIAETSLKKSSLVDVSKIKDDTLIFNEGLFDSMGLMLLITFIEDNFQVQIKDNELVESNFESINAIYALLEKKLQ
jgi:acyl carrier protein